MNIYIYLTQKLLLWKEKLLCEKYSFIQFNEYILFNFFIN